jgi:hypothetical protein
MKTRKIPIHVPMSHQSVQSIISLSPQARPSRG